MKTPKILKILVLVSMSLTTACQSVPSETNKSTVDPETPVAAKPAGAAPTIQDPAPEPSTEPTAATPVDVTVYTASKIEAPVNGWITKTYTATGQCVVYSGNTYCWDDGLKVLDWTYNNFHYGPYGYTYFGVGYFGSHAFTFHGHGSLNEDAMTTPTLVTMQMENNMLVSSASVLTNGTATQVTCTEENSVLTCPGFSIDLNQLPL